MSNVIYRKDALRHYIETHEIEMCDKNGTLSNSGQIKWIVELRRIRLEKVNVVKP